MTEPLIRLVDDEQSILDGESLILRLAGFDVAAYLSAEAFLARDDLSRPGCVVMDLRMTGMSGLECQRALRERGADLPVLFITGHGDMETAVYALKNGAADFVSKPVTAEKLTESCRRLCRWHEEIRRRAEEVGAARELLATLTPREHDVAKLVAEGLANKAAAQQLCVSEQAVKIHRSNVYAKLGVRTAVDIAALLKLAADGDSDSEAGFKTLRVLDT